ncbi:hypothetical protein SAMN05421753_10792 [Planctomicrobium piriforme]|uniref:Uncharacterized protein n=1 Tax=Planctomicrobium piriforme TaxID=1576369 RepID=A0A1I3GQK4_9PLAN|nr:hypothetical protein SAMN05421753_10792 [Planctomicrobium piriforme]
MVEERIGNVPGCYPLRLPADKRQRIDFEVRIAERCGPARVDQQA